MPLRNRDEIMREVYALLDSVSGTVSNLQYELSHYNLQDLAEVFELLSPENRLTILDALSPETSAQLVAETDTHIHRQLISELQPEKITEIVKKMDIDDLVDFLENADEEMTHSVIAAVDSEDKEAGDQLQELRKYNPESAGGIMTMDYLAVRPGTTVEEIIDRIRREEDIETVHYIYITDSDNILKGVLSIRELILHGANPTIDNIMQKEVITVFVDTDQEEVAYAIEKYNLAAIPVTDHHGHLKGIVTVDDIVDVIQEEASEDMMLMAGAGSNIDLLHAPVWQRCRARLPWLLITTIGGLLAAYILFQFEATLQETVAVSFFVPLIMAMGGATGNQSSTILVRSIALGDLKGRTVWWTLKGEIITGCLMGMCCGFVSFLMVTCIGVFEVMAFHAALPYIIGLSMLLGILTAVIMGTLVPLMCLRYKIDPALASGPFIASLNDIIGLMIYLLVSVSLLQTLT